MSWTLTSTDTTITPLWIVEDGYEWVSDSNSFEHTLADGGTSYVLRDGGPWRNTLSLVFDDQAVAKAAGDSLRLGVVWDYADTEFPESSMTVVRTGPVRVVRFRGTVDYWMVVVSVSEVREAGS